MTETSLWKRIASTVVDLEESSPPEAGPVAKPTTSTTQLSPQPVAQPPDAELQEKLMKIGLSRRTIFSGLIEAAEKLRSVPGMDDAQRIKAAAAMSGATARDIEQAVPIHLNDLASEHGKFDREISSVKMKRVDDATRAAEAAEAEAQRLAAQPATFSENAISLRASVAEAVAELATLESAFKATAAYVEQYIVTAQKDIISALK